MKKHCYPCAGKKKFILYLSENLYCFYALIFFVLSVFFVSGSFATFKNEYPESLMTLQDIQSKRQEWFDEGDGIKRSLMTRNSIRASFGIHFFDFAHNNREVESWWDDVDDIDFKNGKTIRENLLSMFQHSGQRILSETFEDYQDLIEENDNIIEQVFLQLNEKFNERFDFVVGEDSLYQVYISVDVHGKKIITVFPDAGVFHIQLNEKSELNIFEVLKGLHFFESLQALLGREFCALISYVQVHRKKKKAWKAPKKDFKDPDRYHCSYTKDNPIFAQDRWDDITTLGIPTYWLEDSVHPCPTKLISPADCQQQLGKLQGKSRISLDYLFYSLCHALYQIRIGLIKPNLPDENQKLKLDQIDAMLSESIRFSLYPKNDELKQLWFEKREISEEQDFLLFSQEVSDKIRASRQWSFRRSLIITLYTPREVIYLQIRDFPVFSILVTLPGEALFYHDTSEEAGCVAKRVPYVPGDPLFVEIWTHLIRRYTDQTGKFRVLATVSDGAGSGYGLPDKSKHPGVREKMQYFTQLTNAPFPCVFPSPTLRKIQAKGVEKTLDLITKLYEIENGYVEKKEADFLEWCSVELSPFKHFSREDQKKLFLDAFEKYNVPQYNRFGLDKLNDLTRQLSSLQKGDALSETLSTVLTIPVDHAYVTHLWSYTYKLVRQEIDERAKVLLTEVDSEAAHEIKGAKLSASRESDKLKDPLRNAPEAKEIDSRAMTHLADTDRVDAERAFPMLNVLTPPVPAPCLPPPPPPPPPPPGGGVTQKDKKTLIRLRTEWLEVKSDRDMTIKYRSALSKAWSKKKSEEHAGWYVEYFQCAMEQMKPDGQELLKGFSILADIINKYPGVDIGNLNEIAKNQYLQAKKQKPLLLPYLIKIMKAKTTEYELICFMEADAKNTFFSGQLISVMEKELQGLWQARKYEQSVDSSETVVRIEPEGWVKSVREYNPARHNAMKLYYRSYLATCGSDVGEVTDGPLILKAVWNLGPFSDLLIGVLPIKMVCRNRMAGFDSLSLSSALGMMDLSQQAVADKRFKMTQKQNIRAEIKTILSTWQEGLKHDPNPDDTLDARIMRLSPPARTALSTSDSEFYFALEKEWIESLSSAFLEAAEFYDRQKKYQDSAALISRATKLLTGMREVLVFDQAKLKENLLKCIHPLLLFSDEVKRQEDYLSVMDDYVACLSMLKGKFNFQILIGHIKERQWHDVAEFIESSGKGSAMNRFAMKKHGSPNLKRSESSDSTESTVAAGSHKIAMFKDTCTPAVNPDEYMRKCYENNCQSFKIECDAILWNTLSDWLKGQNCPTERDIEHQVVQVVSTAAMRQKLKKQFEEIIKKYQESLPDDVIRNYIDKSVEEKKKVDAFRLGIVELLSDEILRLKRSD